MTDPTNRSRAERAVEFLLDSAAEYAAAAAERIKADHMLKVAKALAFKASDSKTASEREADALTSAAYLTAINESVAAEQAYQLLRAQREAASSRVEYWRSLNANQRAAERGFGSAA